MSLDRRLKTYGYHLKLRPRCKELRNIEGYHVLSSNNKLYTEFQRVESKLSFSRWLLKAKHLLPDEVSRVCKEVSESSTVVKLSCRYNDILRMADTKHFRSCVAPGQLGAGCPRRILLDERAALIYHRDKAGKFQGRCVFRLMEDGTVQVLRCYGTVQFDAVQRLLLSLGFAVSPVMEDTVVFFARNSRGA